MKKPLIFVGSRTQLTQLALIAELNDYEILGILDHHYYGNTQSICGIPVVGDERMLLDPTNAEAQCWIRDCVFFPANWFSGKQARKDECNISNLRLDRINILDQAGCEVVNLIHPGTKLWGLHRKYSNFKIGKGVLIDDGCTILMDNVEIGDYCSLSIDIKLGHNTKLNRNVTIAPSVFLRHCEIKDNAFIGMYSKVSALYDKNDLIVIGQNSIVWSETTIEKSLPDKSIYTFHGRILKRNDI